MFPRTVFGKCSYCGGVGNGAQPTTADASSSIDEVGHGYKLVPFRGDYICRICKERILADEQTAKKRDRALDQVSFRARAGFKNTIT
jgi:hypothetical protein